MHSKIIPPDVDNIIVVVVTYNPTTQVHDLLSGLPPSISKIIVDNNSQAESAEIVNKLGEHTNVTVIKNNENYGIAKALNQGIEAAKDLNFKWVLTFDQDSLPANNIIELLINTFDNYPLKNKLALVGVNYNTNYSQYVKNKIERGAKIIEIDTIITSGSMLSVAVFDEIGPFKEDLFIDCVDLEYCLRLKAKGFKILISAEIGLYHTVGFVKTKRILGLNINSTSHSAIRRYYMARNNIILSKKYLFKFPTWVLKKNYYFIMSVLQIILVDDHKKEKLFNTMKGIINGIKDK